MLTPINGRLAGFAPVSDDVGQSFFDINTPYFGVCNLLDKDSPPLPTGLPGVHRHNLRPGFDGSVHDIKGCTLDMRFRLRPRG